MASLVEENESICKYKLSNSLVTKTIKFIKKRIHNSIKKNKTKKNIK